MPLTYPKTPTNAPISKREPRTQVESPKLQKKKSQKKKFKNQQKEEEFKIYVSGLPSCTSREEIEEYLRSFGEIKHVKLPMRKTNGVKECKGHAKVSITCLKTKERFFSQNPKIKFKGKYELKFEGFLEGMNLVEKMVKIEEKKVSIYGENKHKIEDLEECLRTYGKVERVTWKKKDTEEEEYYGNVTFSSKESAEKCLKSGFFSIKPKNLLVKVRPYLTQFANKNKSTTMKLQFKSTEEHSFVSEEEHNLKEVILSSGRRIALPLKDPHSEENTRFNYQSKERYSHLNRHCEFENLPSLAPLNTQFYRENDLPPLLFSSSSSYSQFGVYNQGNRDRDNQGNFSISGFFNRGENENGEFRWLRNRNQGNLIGIGIGIGIGRDFLGQF